MLIKCYSFLCERSECCKLNLLFALNKWIWVKFICVVFKNNTINIGNSNSNNNNNKIIKKQQRLQLHRLHQCHCFNFCLGYIFRSEQIFGKCIAIVVDCFGVTVLFNQQVHIHETCMDSFKYGEYVNHLFLFRTFNLNIFHTMKNEEKSN